MIVIPSTVEGARRETLRVTQPAPPDFARDDN
jgi:hypothetical protein